MIGIGEFSQKFKNFFFPPKDRNEPRPRYELLDSLRGAALIGMAASRVFYSLDSLYGLVDSSAPAVRAIALLSSSLFVFTSGSVTLLSRDTILTALRAILAGAVVLVITVALLPDTPIYFGIVEFVGILMILYRMMGNLLLKIPSYVGIGLYTLMFIISAVGARAGASVELPEGTRSLPGALAALSGVTALYSSESFESSGSAGLSFFANIFLFLTGTAMGQLLSMGRIPEKYATMGNRTLTFIGQHFLAFFILYQPVISLALRLILGSAPA